MYILRVVIFSLDEPNLTRTLTVFKENLGKCKGKRTSRECTFILFLILNTIIISIFFHKKYKAMNHYDSWLFSFLGKKIPALLVQDGYTMRVVFFTD